MINRHAYCIIAHNEPELFEVLVRLIDDIRNDIYVMIDAKSDICLFEGVQTQYSRLCFLSHRVDIRWGDTSQMEAELALFEYAHQQGEYLYYHLLSGADLPLKSQDEIHRLMDEELRGKEFVDIADDPFNSGEAEYRTRYRHLFCRHFNATNILVRYGARILRRVLVDMQRLVGYRREWDGMTIRKGAQWCSISGEFCAYLLEQKEYIMRMFRHVPAVDEIFIQTMLWNSPFRERKYMGEEGISTNFRAIDWGRGNPYVWRTKDLPGLLNGKMLFARKFSIEIDRTTVDTLYNTIRNEK